MLRSCIIDFVGSWDDLLPLAEFSYNNSYHSSIKMASFEALYGRKCKSPVCWNEVRENQFTGPDIIQQTSDKLIQIRKRIKAAQDRQKCYADRRRNLIEFQVGDNVMLKISPWKGVMRFGKRGKLSPRIMSVQLIIMSAQRSEANALPNNEVPIHENAIGQGSTNTRGLCRTGNLTCCKCGMVGHMAQSCRIKEQRCYQCGEPRHIRPNCPDLAPRATRQSKNEKKDSQKPRTRAFNMKIKEARVMLDVVSGTFLVNNLNAQVLFDSSANRSLVSTSFSECFDQGVKKLDKELMVEIAEGNHVMTNRVINNCMITIGETYLPINLIPIQLGKFDIVIGMDWLSENQAKIICNKKMVKLKSPNGEVICIYGDKKSRGLNLISMMKTIKCLRKGCMAYLAYVTKAKEIEKKEVSNIHIVCDFPDVFPGDLPGIPPKRQVEFGIDLIPRATPIAKAPYRLAPTEMQELMKQLQELLDKGIIQPSSSPWGALVLFVKKKDGSMRMCIKSSIGQYIEKWNICLQVKAGHQRPYGSLQPLEIPMWKWDHITMDFIIRLPKTKKGHDAIWVIVDRLSKSTHFLPIRETFSIENLARLYVEEIISRHGIPLLIVSDRDRRCASNFWMSFQKELDFGGSWDDLLPLAEFAYNNSYHSSIKMAPIKAAQDRQKCYADRRRNPVEFQVGDNVMLKISPWKGVMRFGKRGKLSPQEEVTIPIEDLSVDETLSFIEEPESILDTKIKQLRNKSIPLVKVQWQYHRGSEAT
ncbi:putative reverse transcriptase domain-containing protein [Tanacetum coccineum]|uniref:Reverse transcriptase domain-containing protein n=1 Tax=Tanacetum coccineum TaxID=301880 RepID=A0ABQ5GS69_9ASTR